MASPMVLVDAGIFCPLDASQREEAPGTERGYIDILDGIALVDFKTTTVPGELGLGFGIRFQLEAGMEPREAFIITDHPPFGSPPVTRERYSTTVYSDSTNASLFTFDDDYEIQYGEWTLSVEIDGEIVLSQSFNIVPPEDSIISLDLCGEPALLS